MAGTIVDYIRQYGEDSFAERPFSDVDSLALCQLCYLKFDGLVPLVTENKRAVTIKQLAAKEKAEGLFADERFAKENRELFDAMLHSRRFSKMKLNCYINIVEEEWETQFSAVTFLLDDGSLFLAYRGTDETIVGWKEDFNMAFRYPVPGQAYAVKYLNMVMGRLPNPFYLGGHSKGGNLAVYAGMNCPKREQARILKIYSMDGPGFPQAVLEKSGYEAVEERIVKILPHSSLVGMLFETTKNYRVVESRTFGLLQHDPFTWLIDGTDFCYVKGLYGGRRFADDTLNEWVGALDEEQRQIFVDTLYQVVSASKAENLIELTADWKKSMTGMISAMKEVDAETRKALKRIVRELFEIAMGRLKEAGSRSRRSVSRRRTTSVPDAIERRKEAGLDETPPQE